MIKNCPNCNKEFKTYRRRIIYCGAECYHQSQRGKQLVINGVKLVKSGTNKQCPVCGNSFYVNKKSTRKYCSMKCCLTKTSIDNQIFDDSYKSELMRGEKHWNWQGGKSQLRDVIRSSDEYKLFRKGVFERDNYTCQECGARNGNGIKVILNAHHIKPFCDYEELRFDMNNGITLCRKCHYEVGHKNITNRKIFNKRLDGIKKDVHVNL